MAQNNVFGIHFRVNSCQWHLPNAFGKAYSENRVEELKATVFEVKGPFETVFADEIGSRDVAEERVDHIVEGGGDVVKQGRFDDDVGPCDVEQVLNS